jgi:epoxide hydrolase 4
VIYRDAWFERDGVRLHAIEAGPEDGPLYILLHGFPEFWYGWRKQIPVLASAGYRVVAPDQRGYNTSGKPSELSGYGMSELSADVLSIADSLGRSTFSLAGHDWGAAVAWAVALRWPDRLEKLRILNVPHPAVMMRHLQRDPGQLLRSWYMFFFQTPALPEALFRRTGQRMLINTSRSGCFTREDLEMYTGSWKQPGCATGMINWYRALLRTRPPRLEDPLVRVPTTIVWGRKDRFLKPEMARESLEFCPDGKLVYLENATHWVQHEEPVQVNALLL